MDLEQFEKRAVVVGLDPSLNGFGLCFLNLQGQILDHQTWTNRKNHQKQYPKILNFFFMPTGASMTDRWYRVLMLTQWLKDQIQPWIDAGFWIYVAKETYALNANGLRSSDLYELGGQVNSTLWSLGVHVRLYTPQAIKLGATGTGAASKDQMIKAFEKATNKSLKGFDTFCQENLADAYWTAELLRAELLLRWAQYDRVTKQQDTTLTTTTTRGKKPYILHPFIAPVTRGPLQWLRLRTPPPHLVALFEGSPWKEEEAQDDDND